MTIYAEHPHFSAIIQQIEELAVSVQRGCKDSESMSWTPIPLVIDTQSQS